MHLDALRTRSLPAAHLPVIRGIIDQLGIVDVLDAFCPRHPLSKVCIHPANTSPQPRAT